MKLTSTKTALIMTSAIGLAACGGSDDAAGYESLRTSAQTAVAVTVVSQDSGTLAGSADPSATFDGTTDTVTAGATTRTINATSDLTTGLDYVGALDGINSEKFVVVATQASDMPTGTVTYSGDAFVVVPISESRPEDGVYSGQMSMEMTTDFGANTSVDFSNLTGGQLTTTSNPAGGSYTATGSESIVFGDLVVTGNTVSADAGSTLSVDGFGNETSSFTTSGATLDLTGAFAGPQAAEVAGVGSASGSGVDGLSVVFAGGQ